MPSSASPRPEFYSLSLHDALPISFQLVCRLTVRSKAHDDIIGSFQIAQLHGAILPLSMASRIFNATSNAFMPSFAPISGVCCPSMRSEEHTSELQSRRDLVCRLLLRHALSSTLFPYTTLFRSRFNWCAV